MKISVSQLEDNKDGKALSVQLSCLPVSQYDMCLHAINLFRSRAPPWVPHDNEKYENKIMLFSTDISTQKPCIESNGQFVYISNNLWYS